MKEIGNHHHRETKLRKRLLLHKSFVSLSMVVRIFIVYYKGYKIYLKLNFEEKKME